MTLKLDHCDYDGIKFVDSRIIDWMNKGYDPSWKDEDKKEK